MPVSRKWKKDPRAQLHANSADLIKATIRFHPAALAPIISEPDPA